MQKVNITVQKNKTEEEGGKEENQSLTKAVYCLGLRCKFVNSIKFKHYSTTNQYRNISRKKRPNAEF